MSRPRIVQPEQIVPQEGIALNAMLMAVRQGADVICDRWSLSLILSALLGDRRFAQFVRRIGLASRLASMRLRTLVNQGIMVSMPYSLRPMRHDYLLSNMGLALVEVMQQMIRWELNWSPAQVSTLLVDRVCGSRVKPDLRCRACGKVSTARDIRLVVNSSDLRQKPAKQSLYRRSTISRLRSGSALGLDECLEIFGDKWGIEILVCAFTGIRRFKDFRAATGISANILSDRLDRLTAAGILVLDRNAGVRGYRLSTKGIDSYGVLVAFNDWADHWLSRRYRSPVKLLHKACGKVFHLKSAKLSFQP